MAASNIVTTIRRAEPMVKSVFRNAFLHRAQEGAAAALSSSPQLVILFTWVGAKERYAHKFVESWSRRGFNVLQVTTPVIDLVRPKTGTEVTAARVIDFLDENDKSEVILHGLSVGGYLGQRVLMGLQGNSLGNIITHQIYDSFTQVSGFQSGVENAVHPRYKAIAGACVKLYVKLADLSCLQATSDFIYRVPTRAPALFMHSLSDKVANFETIRGMLPAMARGSPVYTLLIPEQEKMGHVSLYRTMGDEVYMSAIIRFLRNNKFSALRPEILDENPNSYEARSYIERMERVSPPTS